MPQAAPTANEAEGLTCERLAHGTPVWVSREHRFGTDAMLLSHFCGVRRAERCCDLGSGCGIIPLRWHDAGHRGLCLAVELQPPAAALLQKALHTPCLPQAAAPALCREGSGAKTAAADAADAPPKAAPSDGLPDEEAFAHARHIIGLCADLRTAGWETAAGGRPLDVVCCNPPYFAGGFVSTRQSRAAARHQLTCTTDDVCRTAARLLRDGGRLCLCQRPAALAQVMAACVAAGQQPKRLRLVRQSPGSRTWLILLDARKAGGVGLDLLDDLVMEGPDGGFSPEVLRIYGKAP